MKLTRSTLALLCALILPVHAYAADTTLSPSTLVQIEEGASEDTWGLKLNNNASIINAWFDAGPALKVANGGTGATTASAARTNLGLGTMATQAASAVAITGGAFNGTVGATTPGTVAGTTGTFSGALSATTGAFTSVSTTGGITAANGNITATIGALVVSGGLYTGGVGTTVFRHTGSGGAYLDFNQGGAASSIFFRNGSGATAMGNIDSAGNWTLTGGVTATTGTFSGALATSGFLKVGTRASVTAASATAVTSSHVLISGATMINTFTGATEGALMYATFSGAGTVATSAGGSADTIFRAAGGSVTTSSGDQMLLIRGPTTWYIVSFTDN